MSPRCRLTPNTVECCIPVKGTVSPPRSLQNSVPRVVSFLFFWFFFFFRCCGRGDYRNTSRDKRSVSDIFFMIIISLIARPIFAMWPRRSWYTCHVRPFYNLFHRPSNFRCLTRAILSHVTKYYLPSYDSRTQDAVPPVKYSMVGLVSYAPTMPIVESPSLCVNNLNIHLVSTHCLRSYIYQLLYYLNLLSLLWLICWSYVIIIILL